MSTQARKHRNTALTRKHYHIVMLIGGGGQGGESTKEFEVAECVGVRLSYVLNTYSRIPVTQPQEYEYRIPRGEPCIRQKHVHIQGHCIHTRVRVNSI